MLLRQTIVIEAGEHERFAPHSWDSQIGKEVPVNLRETDDGPLISRIGRGRLVAAEVAEDGSSVTLTVETSDADADLLSRVGGELNGHAGGLEVLMPVSVEGVRVLMTYPEYWQEAPQQKPGVHVVMMSGTGGPGGCGIEQIRFVRVPPDLAHDLSHNPEAVVKPSWGDALGIRGYHIVVLGLIEAEAEEAFMKVCVTVEERLLPWSRGLFRAFESDPKSGGVC